VQKYNTLLIFAITLQHFIALIFSPKIKIIMNQRVRLVVNDLKERRKVYSDADCARVIGLEKADFSRMMSGKKPINQRFVDRLVAQFPEINKEWLLTGEGEMLKNASATAENHSISIAGEEIKENKINVNTDETIAMLVAEVAAQRKLTEKVLEQNSDLIAIIAGKR
jgi:plasmid maintenance system antidote protein VapI